MERWTRIALRFRWPFLVIWAAVLVSGFYASTRLSALQSNVFAVPGTDSEHAREILEDRFGDRPDGSFTVVFSTQRPADAALKARLQRVVDDASKALPGGRPTQLVPGSAEVRYGDVVAMGSANVLYADIVTTLNLAKAKGYTDELRAALHPPPGVKAYVTGAAAIQHDLDPILDGDLQKGETIALPIAALVLLAVFGLSGAATIPFLFAGCAIFGTLGLVWAIAHAMTIPTYTTNLVFLIGLGIAIDYSLLAVYRFREELAHGLGVEEAILRTMSTAGRAVVVSGGTVAIGLGMLLVFPIPFVRAIGVGSFLIPLVSIAAAMTLQPALLSLYGRRGTARVHTADFLRARRLPLPRFAGTEDVERGFWARLARSIMRRPIAWLAGGAALLIAAGLPVFGLHLTPGSIEGIPRDPPAVRGFDVLRAAVGPGAISPVQVIVDTGVLRADVELGIEELAGRLRDDPEVAFFLTGEGDRFVDSTGQYRQVLVVGKHEYGAAESQSLVRRLRREIVPAVPWPPGVRVLVGGGPAQGVDFLDRSYSAFPWLVLVVLVLTYLLLLRAFRSLLLPLKAVVLNLLSISASYGMLVVFFRWGLGKDLIGLYQFEQIEGWIPIFLFAMLFGLSMDYEVFLVSRMREAWDQTHDNARAVAIGLERTGRIVTAAAAIMVAAFSGFLVGRIIGLQQFGLGLAVAVLVDATLVRAILVPALMAVMGRFNWWLPDRVARLARVQPSPLAARPAGK